MLVNVCLHGIYAQYHQGPIRVVANTIAEAIEAVTRQIKGFQPDAKGRKLVRIVGVHRFEDLYKPINGDVHIFPSFQGGKNTGWIQIGIGAVLIALSFVPGNPIAGITFKLGVLLILGGVAQLLAPTPEDDRSKEKKNQYLGTPRNTVEMGTRIPILYGTQRVYGHYISADVSAKEYRRQ